MYIRGSDSSGTIAGAVYENKGAGSFAQLVGIGSARGAWGDYDNDGRPDLIGGSLPAFVLRNLGSNTFAPANFSFTSALPQNSVWADTDGDGHLDIISMRRNPSGFAYVPVWYRNNDTSLNAAPAPPESLSANVVGDSVVLSWAAAVDINQSGGHSYNVVVGSASGQRDVVSPHAQLASGRLLLNALGNAGVRTNYLLEKLPAGEYYWRVQAIDHSYASSRFSAEQQFTIGASPGIVIDSTTIENDSILLGISRLTGGEIVLEVSANLENWTELSRHPVSGKRMEIRTPLGERHRFYKVRH